MKERQHALGDFLDKIADELNISDTMMEKAVKSYEAVGKWIGNGIDYDVCIKPQGSMNLGTVVRPIDDSDDYDMDLVCLLRTGQNLPLSDIKSIVGDRLKANDRYASMLEKEGKRCWTMRYDEFHMDILPCVPKEKVYIPKIATAIKLTHREGNNQYTEKYSNPEAYHDWFVRRMLAQKELIEKNSIYAKRKTEIDKVPTYRRRTVMQKTIQLLKRHRDIMFQKNDNNAPISIIITTLAALAYKGEDNVYDALSNILKTIPDYIQITSGKYKLLNPVMSDENFAEKWNENHAKADCFFNWLSTAHKDLLENPLKFTGLDLIADTLKSSLGEAPVKRAVNKCGDEMKSCRDDGRLYAAGLTGGLGVIQNASAIKVKGHTFFGK
ncbi:hypothetical protein SAMN02910317_02844 [Ruminococcaceae bacterium FB2012]|nr:hypothetical protein SAMN02910317_02844 [Ruminococcaceae bacterium FB2012]